MRHLRNISKLGRNCGHRKALLVNLACSLIEHGQIKTTIHRAKEARKLVDALITYAKKGGEHNRRLAAQRLKINTPSDKLQGKKFVLDKLFNELAAAYAQRPGGYTRIIHLGHRAGDGAQFVMIQLVEAGDAAKKETQPAAEATVEAEAKAE
ncbi:MAG: 50S ribosomal protein L17 [Lentisphaeria bacterium]|nr:50S ribosomal protein L17 [Lentisphaeria bacterium]